MYTDAITTMKINADALLEDTDRGTRFGYASGPAISPPEEDYLIAEVHLKIDVEQLKTLEDGLQDGFEVEIVDTRMDNEGMIVVELRLTGEMMLERRGALYERPIR
jgi:hypothetical protein